MCYRTVTLPMSITPGTHSMLTPPLRVDVSLLCLQDSTRTLPAPTTATSFEAWQTRCDCDAVCWQFDRCFFFFFGLFVSRTPFASPQTSLQCRVHVCVCVCACVCVCVLCPVESPDVSHPTPRCRTAPPFQPHPNADPESARWVVVANANRT